MRSRISVADPNGDGDPEITVDTFSGGAHCCTVLRIYGYHGGRYRRTLSQPWGNAECTITDLDGDGTAEISGSDDVFAYAFSSFASSVFPPKVLRYVINSGTGHAHVRNGRRGYPKLIRSQAFHVRKDIRSVRLDPAYETKGCWSATSPTSTSCTTGPRASARSPAPASAASSSADSRATC